MKEYNSLRIHGWLLSAVWNLCSRLVQIETSCGSTAVHQHMQKHQGDGAPDECSAISKQQKQIKKLSRCKSETKCDGEGKLFIHFFKIKSTHHCSNSVSNN
ncbi:hypothetical protein BDA96_09G032000 [Sorghum bicolor]|uniref:Secreted protein n=1 Tax=Sorghum bicolor TaxID=4558 RepID=A0A921QAQ0_SORBI|nr:hypothetical protein BDA96_09G032000 [Sorghum bicolor]